MGCINLKTKEERIEGRVQDYFVFSSMFVLLICEACDDDDDDDDGGHFSFKRRFVMAGYKAEGYF